MHDRHDNPEDGVQYFSWGCIAWDGVVHRAVLLRGGALAIAGCR